jgi:hypothetical protein
MPAETPASPVMDEMPMRREEDAIDLYELGAEDYKPENIHHNA